MSGQGTWLEAFDSGLAANRPTVMLAAAPFCFYYATDTGVLYVGTGALGGTITWGGAMGGGVIAIPDATTYAVPTDASGSTLVVPNLTANIVISLPAPKKGFSCDIVYGGAAADAQSWSINTGAAANFYIGSLLAVTPTGPVDAAVFSNGTTNKKIAVTTPSGGTKISLLCDGVNWYASGVVVAATAVAFTD